MKTCLLNLFLLGVSVNAFAQTTETWGDIPVLTDAYGHKISSDGSFSIGEAVSIQSIWARDNTTGEVFVFEDSSLGDGNNITDDHVFVGTYKKYMKAAIFSPLSGEVPELIPSLEKYYESYANGINREGTRIVGFLYNPNASDAEEINPELQTMQYLPFYCDRNPQTGEIMDPVILPTPEKDFFNVTPQYCTAVWVSDDAKTILGQVISNSGVFIYPIVYKEEENGNWSYSLPSEKLFNPNKLPVPSMPVPEMASPDPLDYIGNPEFKALFEELLELYQGGVYDVDPYDMLNPEIAGSDALMTMEEWENYQKYVEDYNIYMSTIYNLEVDEYYEAYGKLIADCVNFLQSENSMNSSGTMIGQTQIRTYAYNGMPVTYLNPVLFNLEDGSITTYGNEYSELKLMQILPDGTLIGASPKPGYTTPDLTPQHSYACAPGGSEFIPIEDYIKNSNPDLYEWYQEYLYHEVPVGYDEASNIVYKNMTVSGLVAVNDDFTALSGGVDAWSWDLDNGEYYTYFFSGMKSPDAGVKKITDISELNGFKVYNLQGIKVMETMNSSELQSLGKGIYIINGKKVIL